MCFQMSTLIHDMTKFVNHIRRYHQSKTISFITLNILDDGDIGRIWHGLILPIYRSFTIIDQIIRRKDNFENRLKKQEEQIS